MGDIYNETTALRKHKKLMGQEVETDDGLEWRVKWGQRGAGTFSLLAVICLLQDNILLLLYLVLLAYICWYIVLQKRLVCYCETIVARDERGGNSRIRSVQLEY